MNIGIVIPACDEEMTVGEIVRRCRKAAGELGRARIVVCDNDSHDRTAEVAREAGAAVVSARPRGYGRACLECIRHLGDWPDVLLFLDADGSSLPEEMGRLLGPILEDGADLVMGLRPSDSPMSFPQRWGTRLATALVRLRWGRRFLDMGPFRAVRREAYERLAMRDTTWGWTVEMQILALMAGLRIEEVPVSWEKRLAGVSKISGTLSGVVRAGARILWTVGRYSLKGEGRGEG